MTDLNRHFDENIYDLNAILHPGTVFDHPRDVLADTMLSRAEKRAILASWASDAAAVTSCPSLRYSRDEERRVDRRYPGSAFQPGSLAANATRRQAGKAEVDRPGCDGSLIEPHHGEEGRCAAAQFHQNKNVSGEVSVTRGHRTPFPTAPIADSRRSSDPRY